MRRDLRIEALWIPDKPSELPDALEGLRAQLFDAGRSIAEVNGITGWLFAKAIGEKDLTAAPTRSRYRRILGELGAPSDAEPVLAAAA